MKTMLKLISALLYFNFMCVVSTYYLFDDKASDSGYISPLNGVAYANYGSLHKKRYSGNSNSKFMRGASGHNNDYQFNLIKTPTYNNYGVAQPWNGNNRSQIADKLITETPTILERPKHDASVVKPPPRDSREESSPSISKDPLPNSNVNRPQKNPRSNGAHNEHFKAQAKEKPMQHSYEMYKTLEVNVNKKPILSDPQKNIRNRLASSLSINSFPNYYRRLQTAANMGMHEHKLEKYSDPNAPLLYKMLENMSNKLPARKPKTYDFRKRDTTGNVVQMHVVPHELIKDDVLKLTSKEIVKDHIKRADANNNNFVAAEVNVASNDKPYAVFYRMNPVALAGPEEIQMNNMDVNPGGNKGPVNINTENEVMVVQHQQHPGAHRDTAHHGGVKIHTKIKNFSSYKKY